MPSGLSGSAVKRFQNQKPSGSAVEATGGESEDRTWSRAEVGLSGRGCAKSQFVCVSKRVCVSVFSLHVSARCVVCIRAEWCLCVCVCVCVCMST